MLNMHVFSSAFILYEINHRMMLILMVSLEFKKKSFTCTRSKNRMFQSSGIDAHIDAYTDY